MYVQPSLVIPDTWLHIQQNLPGYTGHSKYQCNIPALMKAWCVKSSVFTRLHSARLGYDSCLVFLPLGLPQSRPKTTLPGTKVRGNAVKAGHPNLLSPK